jgi:ppGpp synthetase/RelA/SpoT-type nucleotidyltranferase
MTDIRKASMPKTDVGNVLAEFEERQPTLTTFCAKTKALIEACLQDADIRYQSVQARVKTKKKLKEKYLDPAKDYVKLDDITDLAGLRVITYYDDEIDRVVGVVEEQFKIDKKESVDKRSTDPDRFGYRAVNLICSHLDRRTSDVEYKHFAGVCCEIQVTSILGHAWSEIEHEWYDLKDAYPNDVKRRFSIIAALFELAGREFVEIRKLRADYGRSVALQVEARVPDIPVDAVSLRTFTEQEPVVGEVDGVVSSLLGFSITTALSDSVLELRSKLLNLVGITKLEDLRGALKTHRKSIPEFMKRCRAEAWPSAPKAPSVQKGVCIYQLALLLASERGAETVSAFFDLLGPRSNLGEDQLMHTLAKKVLAEVKEEPS